MADFVVGANLPWLDYGQDFGANAWQPKGGVARPERRERMRRALDRLARRGARLVRWWLLGDGRAGLREGGEGTRLGLDEPFFHDLDAALAALREAGLQAMFVLSDFLWFEVARSENGVRLGGRGHLVRDRGRREELLERVFAPIAERCGREPTIASWDLFNEPEWATLGLGTNDPLRAIPPEDMRRFLRELASLFHARATQPVTVGLASARWLSLVGGLDLDFHQVHWYERKEPLAGLARPVESWGAGRPILLGEFPTRGTSVPPPTIVETAWHAGYSGALAWSLLAADDSTDGVACEDVLAARRAQRTA